MSANGHTRQSEARRPAVLFALPDERRFFGREYHSLSIVRGDGGVRVQHDVRWQPSVHDAECIADAACIGVGRENAYSNTSLLLESSNPVSGVIVVGFAGGLSTSVRPGGVVVADAVLDVGARQQHRPDTGLLNAAAQVAVPSVQVSCGLLATADRTLVRAAEKRELARQTGAIAVDMESAGAIAAATRYGVPWLAVRVITDGVDDDLPFDFNAPQFKASADPNGGVDRGRIVASALLQPWKIPALIRLGSRSSLAAKNLALFLHALLSELPEL